MRFQNTKPNATISRDGVVYECCVLRPHLAVGVQCPVLLYGFHLGPGTLEAVLLGVELLPGERARLLASNGADLGVYEIKPTARAVQPKERK